MNPVTKSAEREITRRMHALLVSLDAEEALKLYNYMRQFNGLGAPANADVPLAGIHKARCVTKDPRITDQMREVSRVWLKQRNMTAGIGPAAGGFVPPLIKVKP